VNFIVRDRRIEIEKRFDVPAHEPRPLKSRHLKAELD
jgi:hypothetical protein